jgi:uncharacterized protein (TIGR02266 family)
MLERACDYTTRTEPRIPTALSLVFKERDNFVKAYTSNVSTGGLAIKTENPLPLGHQFVLKLKLPGVQEPMQIKCEVMWAHKREESTPENPPGMGVKFIEISEKDFLFLKKYISGIASDG